MAIKIEDREYTVNPDVISNLTVTELTKIYEKAGDLQFLIMPIARGVLSKMEKEARKKDQDWTLYRPAKKQDPVEFLIALIGKTIQAVFTHGNINIITTENRTIQAIQVTDQAGRPLAFDGHIGVREDDGVKVS